jgi:aryl-alcohol dehydrogenase-like predicted oxidoreductase
MTTLGRGGPEVSRAGLGLMAMSGIYGAADDEESLATIRAALDAGITLLDTGDFYGMGHNELLLSRARCPGTACSCRSSSAGSATRPAGSSGTTPARRG